MLVTQVLGNIEDRAYQNTYIDFVAIEWFNTQKRIALLRTNNGQEVALRFEKPLDIGLNHGDILIHNEQGIIAVCIIPVHILVMQTKDNTQIAQLCYEIGNYHIPLFFGQNVFEFKAPFEKPLQRLLEKLCIDYKEEYGILNSKERLGVHIPIFEPKLKTSNVEVIVKS